MSPASIRISTDCTTVAASASFPLHRDGPGASFNKLRLTSPNFGLENLDLACQALLWKLGLFALSIIAPWL